MDLVNPGPLSLAIAAGLVVLLALLNLRWNRPTSRDLLWSMVRMGVQLALIGLVLEFLFRQVSLVWVSAIACVMLLAAGREVVARQRRHLQGAWAWAIGTGSMFISSLTLTVLALTVLLHVEPWYQPQYAIPLLGMLLGNTLNGIAIAMDRVTQGAVTQRQVIETRLALGHTWQQATGTIRQEALQSALIPTINSMAAAGIVALPGMMTGQILAGAPPATAVAYQILILLLIAAGTGFATLFTAWAGTRRLFDARQRLRLDRLTAPRNN